MMRRCSLLLIGLGTAATACLGSDGGDTPTPPPTLVAVAPEDFLGSVRCGTTQGTMQTYVATLYDVTPDLNGVNEPTPFPLPSSGPVSCFQPVSFGFVVPGHKYIAEIDGYETGDLAPLGSTPQQPNSGSRTMVSGGSEVRPTWRVLCSGGEILPLTSDGGGDAAAVDADAEAAADADADGAAPDGGPSANDGSMPLTGPVTAVRYATRFVRGCASLEPSDDVTGLTIDLPALASDVSCGNTPDLIAKFEIRKLGDNDGTSDPPIEAPCPASEPIEFLGLTAGESYTFEVLAFEEGSTVPARKTSCFGVARHGAVLTAACDPFPSPPSLPSAP